MVLAMLCALPGLARAQWLELKAHPGGAGGTGWFSVNEERKFLVFVSYFDALDVGYPEFSADLQYLKDRGVHGVRIFPNWWHAPHLYSAGPLKYAQDTLFDPSGNLRPLYRDHLYEYLNRAKQAGMVVDLSFSPETVSSNFDTGGPDNLTWEEYKNGLRQITVALRDRGDRHVMFDIANEANINGPCNSVTPPANATCRGMVPNVTNYSDLAAFVAELARRFSTEHSGRGVNLLTYHRAKGLEFDAVFLPRLVDGELPFRSGRAKADAEEERRLLYVGITRARRYLFLTWPTDGRARPSQFLDELELAPTVPPRTSSTPRPSVTVRRGGALFDRLREWRRKRAQADGVPAYVVFHDRTLAEIAERKPRDWADLAAVAGVGPAKLERYADEVLAVVSAG